MSLKKILDDWATVLSTKASEKGTSIQESTDAFKAVTSYYAATQKRGKKATEDDETAEPGSFTFNDEVVNGSPGQRAQVRARRNS